MNRNTSYTAALALAVAAIVGLSACGGGSKQSSGSSSGASSSAAADTVSLKSVSGVGNVLVDSKGFALYSPVQERTGSIMCTGSCTTVWVPLTL